MDPDSDPDARRVGSASFCCVWIRIGIIARQMKKLINYTFFHKIPKFYSKYLKWGHLSTLMGVGFSCWLYLPLVVVSCWLLSADSRWSGVVVGGVDGSWLSGVGLQLLVVDFRSQFFHYRCPALKVVTE